MDEFLNRVNAQKKVLRLVNQIQWTGEQLISLNEKTIKRWVKTNHLLDEDAIVKAVWSCSELLFTLATRSQEQISEEYQNNETAFRMTIKTLESEVKKFSQSASP